MPELLAVRFLCTTMAKPCKQCATPTTSRWGLKTRRTAWSRRFAACSIACARRYATDHAAQLTQEAV